MTITRPYAGIEVRVSICRKDFVMNIRNLGKGTQRKRILIAIVAAVIAGSNYGDAEDGNGPIETYTSAIKEFQGTTPWGGSDGRFCLLEHKLQFSEATISYALAQNNTFGAIKAEGNGGFFKRLLDAYIEEVQRGSYRERPGTATASLAVSLGLTAFSQFGIPGLSPD